MWTGVLALFWWTALCLWVAFRPEWTERERLAYPLVTVPVRMTEEISPAGGTPLFANRLLWVGLTLPALYHFLNVAHLFNPQVVAPGPSYHLGSIFTERPLSALSGLVMWHRPELVGLGYLVPMDVLFSVWFFYLAEQLAGVAGMALGIDRGGFPQQGAQAIGAYVATGLFLIYTSRRHLGRLILTALSASAQPHDGDEPLPHRVAVIGGALGFAGLLGIAWAMGVAPWVGLMFFGLIFLCGLV